MGPGEPGIKARAPTLHLLNELTEGYTQDKLNRNPLSYK